MSLFIPVAADAFFLCVATFLICFTTLRFSLSLGLSAMIAAVFSFLISAVFLYFMKKRTQKKLATKEDVKRLQKCVQTLGLMPYKEADDFFFRLLSKKLSGTIAFGEEGRNFYRTETDYSVFLPTYYPISAKHVLSVWKSNPDFRPLTVYTLSAESEAVAICKTLKIELKQADDLYLLMKETNLFPPFETIEKTSLKTRLKTLASSVVKRKQSKRFFFLGSWMLVFSIFIPYPVYYLVCGSLFLSVSLLTRLFGAKESG